MNDVLIIFLLFLVCGICAIVGASLMLKIIEWLDLYNNHFHIILYWFGSCSLIIIGMILFLSIVGVK